MKKNSLKNHIWKCLLCAVMLSATALYTGGCSFIVINHPDDTAEASGDTVGSSATEKQPETEPPVTETDEEGDPVQTRDTASREEKEASAQAYLDALREENFDGINIIIAASEEGAAFGEDAENEIFRSEVLSEIRDTRTTLVENKYNVRFLTFSYAAEDLYKEVRNAYNSDTQYVADFYAIPSADVGKYQAQGLISNLRSLPFTDFSQNYYNKKAMREASAGHGIYAAMGDYTISPENMYAVFFNKSYMELLQAGGMENPYTLVNNDAWTWETFFTYAKAAREQSGGTAWGDNLGCMDTADAEALYLSSSYVRMAKTRVDTTPYLSANTESIQKLADLFYTSVIQNSTSPDSTVFTEDIPDDSALFADGDMLFYVGTLSHLYAWADIDTAWGILPLPKADTSQSSYITYAGDTSVICAPAVIASTEMTGMLLQGLFAASYGCYEDAFLNDALQYYVRDSETVDMLELIFHSTAYDFAAMFSSGYSSLSAATVGAFHNTLYTRSSFQTLYDRNQASADKELAAAFAIKE